VTGSTPAHRTRTRWIRFNLVGAMGFALQTLALWLLVTAAGLSAGVAITIAVLAAVSHNFVWHEHFTWPKPREKRFNRWLAFHVSTGVVSVLTNLGITMIVMTATGLAVVPANIIAVALASFANFWINDRLIFRSALALNKSGGSVS
jgi:putative flippase GtrA